MLDCNCQSQFLSFYYVVRIQVQKKNHSTAPASNRWISLLRNKNVEACLCSNSHFSLLQFWRATRLQSSFLYVSCEHHAQDTIQKRTPAAKTHESKKTENDSSIFSFSYNKKDVIQCRQTDSPYSTTWKHDCIPCYRFTIYLFFHFDLNWRMMMITLLEWQRATLNTIYCQTRS